MKYKENQGFPLRDEFLNQLKSHSGSSISEIYRHLFTAMESGNLEIILDCILADIEKEDWFYFFHKSIRQTDFFDGVFVRYQVETRSEKEILRTKELEEIIPKTIRIYGPVDGDSFSEEYREYKNLRRKSNSERERNVGANLDMALWNLIHLDRGDFLMKFMEKFFRSVAVRQND